MRLPRAVKPGQAFMRPHRRNQLAREERRITADDILRAAGTAAEMDCGKDQAKKDVETWFIARRARMFWLTPTLVEICIGLEINGYLPAEF
jgi:coenzyme PQQ precursor peptide PqqA